MWGPTGAGPHRSTSRGSELLLCALERQLEQERGEVVSHFRFARQSFDLRLAESGVGADAQPALGLLLELALAIAPHLVGLALLLALLRGLGPSLLDGSENSHTQPSDSTTPAPVLRMGELVRGVGVMRIELDDACEREDAATLVLELAAMLEMVARLRRIVPAALVGAGRVDLLAASKRWMRDGENHLSSLVGGHDLLPNCGGTEPLPFVLLKIKGSCLPTLMDK